MSPGCEHNVAEENCDIVIIVIILICLEIVDTFSDARTIWCEGPGNTELVSEPQVSHHADQTGHIHHHYLSLPPPDNQETPAPCYQLRQTRELQTLRSVDKEPSSFPSWSRVWRPANSQTTHGPSPPNTTNQL